MQTYEEAMLWIEQHRAFGIKPGLERMEWLLEALDHPERRLTSIHIGGTNGKGSTVTYLRSILEDAGLQVGTFTSPYVVQFEERISVNGRPIQPDDFVKAAAAIKPQAEKLANTELGSPTEFEILTTIAMWHFANTVRPDIVLWEVGLGGRYDSTNVIYPLLTAITNVGMDHTHILGDTIEQIAREKAGIIKSGVPVITSAANPGAQAVIAAQSKCMHAPYYERAQQFCFRDAVVTETGGEFSVQTPFAEYRGLGIPMLGKHQIENATLAVMIADYLRVYKASPVTPESIRSGLARAFWPGRLEKVQDAPRILLDGAHNPEGIEQLSRFLQEVASEGRIYILTAVTKEKDVGKMFAPLFELAPERFVVTSFDHPRSADPTETARALPTFVEACPSWNEVLTDLQKQADPSDMIIVTGSLFLISEVRRYLLAQSG